VMERVYESEDGSGHFLFRGEFVEERVRERVGGGVRVSGGALEKVVKLGGSAAFVEKTFEGIKTIGLSPEWARGNTVVPMSCYVQVLSCDVLWWCWVGLMTVLKGLVWVLFKLAMGYPVPAGVVASVTIVAGWLRRSRGVKKEKEELYEKVSAMVYERLQSHAGIDLPVDGLRDDIVYELAPKSSRKRAELRKGVWAKVVNHVSDDSRVQQIEKYVEGLGVVTVWKWVFVPTPVKEGGVAETKATPKRGSIGVANIY